MKIVHLVLVAAFPDGYSYQENLLTKHHKLLGHDVSIIASLGTFDENGKNTYLKEGGQYINENGIPVERLMFRYDNRLGRKLHMYKGLYEALEREQPDILFIHQCQFVDIGIVIRWLKKHPNVVVYVDNHADFSNSATNPVSKFIHCTLWRNCAHRIEPYTKMFYGVLPARVDFLKNVYTLPPEKIRLLVMGADDEAVARSAKPEVRAAIREKYGIRPDDFLIMNGGKINEFKTQTLLLMQAVRNLHRDNLRLIVFGAVVKEMKQQVEALVDGTTVQFIGWMDAKDSYDLFASADLCCFPGRHSVFWEQVAAQGIPLMVKKWDGTTHVDVGGNVIFLTQDSEEEIRTNIARLMDEPETYQKMLEAAKGPGMREFAYSHIAKRSIEEE